MLTYLYYVIFTTSSSLYVLLAPGLHFLPHVAESILSFLIEAAILKALPLPLKINVMLVSLHSSLLVLSTSPSVCINGPFLSLFV